MTPEVIFGVVVALMIVAGLLSGLLPKARPKEKYFRCARCNSLSQHTARTINAWRSDKAKFYCVSCHAIWLTSHPSPEQHQALRPLAAQRSGCLGVMLLAAAVPASCALWWLYA